MSGSILITWGSQAPQAYSASFSDRARQLLADRGVAREVLARIVAGERDFTVRGVRIRMGAPEGEGEVGR